MSVSFGGEGPIDWGTIEIRMEELADKLLPLQGLSEALVERAVRDADQHERIPPNRWAIRANIEGKDIVAECCVAADRSYCKVVLAFLR